ncbi:hypothetical protein BGZ60DRAFT_238122 [Tricladium varicosporioides]|nr:hypothetical protein BGZ60DRAFT_238122 [Hymenoscyphus varicosporioides]
MVIRKPKSLISCLLPLAIPLSCESLTSRIPQALILILMLSLCLHLRLMSLLFAEQSFARSCIFVDSYILGRESDRCWVAAKHICSSNEVFVNRSIY